MAVVDEPIDESRCHHLVQFQRIELLSGAARDWFRDNAHWHRLSRVLELHLDTDVGGGSPLSGDDDFSRLIEAVQLEAVWISVVSTLRHLLTIMADEPPQQAGSFIELEDLAPQIAQASPARRRVEFQPRRGPISIRSILPDPVPTEVRPTQPYRTQPADILVPR